MHWPLLYETGSSKRTVRERKWVTFSASRPSRAVRFRAAVQAISGSPKFRGSDRGGGSPGRSDRDYNRTPARLCFTTNLDTEQSIGSAIIREAMNT
jgi:hypothetical protein